MQFIGKLMRGEYSLIKTVLIFGYLVFVPFLLIYMISYTLSLHLVSEGTIGPQLALGLILVAQGLVAFYGYVWLKGFINTFKKYSNPAWKNVAFFIIAFFPIIISLGGILGLFLKTVDYISNIF